jgi:DNA-binding CsgD family transcriptional regulator
MQILSNYLYRFSFIIFLFFASVINIVAQSIETDSIFKLLKNTENLDDKYRYYCDLCFFYREADSTKSYIYGYEALHIAEKQKSLKNKAVVYDYLGSASRFANNIYKQVLFADSSLLLANASGDEEALAYANYSTAYKYNAIGESEKYVSFMLSSLSYFEKEKKRYDKLVSGYENLAAHFSNTANQQVQKKYAEKTLSIARESKDVINIANALTTWGLFLTTNAEKETSVNYALLDSAEACYIEAIKIFEQNMSRPNIRFNYARTCINLSSMYVYHFYNKRPQETLNYLDKTETVCLKYDDPILLMVAYGQKTQYYTYKKNILGIETSLQKVEESIKKQHTVEPNYFALLYKNYMDLAELKNDFSSYRKYFNLYDSSIQVKIDKENTTKDFNASIKFETEKKNNEISLLTSSVEANKKIKYLFIGIAVLALLSLLFMYMAYYFKQKTFMKAQELLQEEKLKAELNTKLKEEEALNAIMGKELADQDRLVAIQENLMTLQQKEKLEQELMSNSLQLERKNQFLKELKEKLPNLKTAEQNDIKRLSRTLDKSLEVDEEFDLLRTSFENTNPKFFAHLQEKAESNLTKLDLKYCGYIKLGMRTKEIANLMSIEAKSMRMARYRIKQKLHLDKDVDLDDFILAI